MSDSYLKIATFELFLDRYNGVTIELTSLPSTKEEFSVNLKILLEELNKQKRNLLWINIPILKADFIEVATKVGFVFHTCHKDKLLLVKELIKDAIIPTASNHTIGVGVVVTNDKNEILLVKERVSNVGFKLPGGHIDDGELIQCAVRREVKEETGIDVVFESITSLGHFYPHQFDKSNLYILCCAKPLNFDICIKDTKEIIDSKWIDIDTFLSDENGFEYNKKIIKEAIKTEGMKATTLKSFKNIQKDYELFFLE